MLSPMIILSLKLLPCQGPQSIPTWEEETHLTKPSTNLDISPKSEPALELHSRAAHHRSDGPDAGRNPEEGG